MAEVHSTERIQVPVSWLKFIQDDIAALLMIATELTRCNDTHFVGDPYLAQALFRWMAVMFEARLCLLTPLGAASTHISIDEHTVVMAWEPASRTWCVFPRSGPRLTFVHDCYYQFNLDNVWVPENGLAWHRWVATRYNTLGMSIGDTVPRSHRYRQVNHLEFQGMFYMHDV
jgi:hypothetical protein